LPKKSYNYYLYKKFSGDKQDEFMNPIYKLMKEPEQQDCESRFVTAIQTYNPINLLTFEKC